MVNKQLINGLKYEKLSEEQLYDLSRWELVDIILAYRNELLRKEQECEELKKKCNIYTCGICGNKEDCNKLYKTLTEIKEIAMGIMDDDLDESSAYYEAKQILQKISECEANK